MSISSKCPRIHFIKKINLPISQKIFFNPLTIISLYNILILILNNNIKILMTSFVSIKQSLIENGPEGPVRARFKIYFSNPK